MNIVSVNTLLKEMELSSSPLIVNRNPDDVPWSKHNVFLLRKAESYVRIVTPYYIHQHAKSTDIIKLIPHSAQIVELTWKHWDCKCQRLHDMIWTI